ncbi:MAG TPA: GNAT family N-acetyltransferase [Myxococcales bacterium]
MDEIERETRDVVRFWSGRDDDGIAGVMGVQARGDVELIRHAYVSTLKRNDGIGAALLLHLQAMTTVAADLT